MADAPRLGLLLLLVLGHISHCLGQSLPDGPAQYHHRVQMDLIGRYILSWTPLEHDIDIQVEVATHGYVGLGFSPTGGMKGADIVIGWVDGRGHAYLSDRYGTGDRTPDVDSSQDVTLVGGRRNDTHTVLRFRRPWTTCDPRQDVAIQDSTTKVIWSYDSAPPPPSISAKRLPRHDHRGTKSLYLKGGADVPTPALTEDLQHWDIRAPNVSLPNDANTLYWCKLYKMPPLSRKHHYVGYEPLIAENMLPHVHHMILYECHANTPSNGQYFDQWLGQPGAQCYAANMPESWNACNMPLVAWAIGSDGVFLPEHTGFPLGEEHDGATYFMLEIHYDNPNLMQGLVDQSGLRVYHTPQLRRYDAGVLQMGHAVEPFHIIPPGREWYTTAHCTADCTRLTLPPTGINVFSSVLHAHVLGRAITLQHIRYGTELPTLIYDDNYDFNYQQERILPVERTILPGDHFIVTCKYDSRNKRNSTFGGFKTTEEMCLVFLSYYPRQRLTECFSRPDLALVLDTLGVQNMRDNNRVLNSFKQKNFDLSSVNLEREAQRLEAMNSLTTAGQKYHDFELSNYLRTMIIDAPSEMNGTSLLDLLNSPWLWRQEAMVQTLQHRMTRGQYEPYCLNPGRQIPKGMPKKGKYPPFTPYVAPQPQCKRYNDVVQVLRATEPPSQTVTENNRFVPLYDPNQQPDGNSGGVGSGGVGTGGGRGSFGGGAGNSGGSSGGSRGTSSGGGAGNSGGSRGTSSGGGAGNSGGSSGGSRGTSSGGSGGDFGGVGNLPVRKTQDQPLDQQHLPGNPTPDEDAVRYGYSPQATVVEDVGQAPAGMHGSSSGGKAEAAGDDIAEYPGDDPRPYQEEPQGESKDKLQQELRTAGRSRGSVLGLSLGKTLLLLSGGAAIKILLEQTLVVGV